LKASTEQIKEVMRQMIQVSEFELTNFLENVKVKTYLRNEIITNVDTIPNEIYFINRGLIRVMIIDKNGTEHSIHFALENQFIADYSNFIQQQPAVYTLQALEETEVLILPRSTIEWGYENLIEGQKMGRLIAEYYFIYQDDRIKNTYSRTAKQRYDTITNVFPNIHSRVPQHMIASYLGITPVHLSRLKKAEIIKR
jgi:CRP-like cAMP-binding protein